MTALVWMLTWLPQVLSGTSELPMPVNLTLNSTHFRHVLGWESGPGTPTGVYYLVEVSIIRSTSWKLVAGCEHVQYPLVCNLTDALSKPHESYFVRVTAQLGAQKSKAANCQEFQPFRNTQLDLPLLTVTPCGRNLCGDLKPPMEHLREIYESLQYTLKINCTGTDEAENVFAPPYDEELDRGSKHLASQFVDFKTVKSLGRQILENVVPGRQYCVSIRFSDKVESRESNYSQPVCAFIPIFPADRWIIAGLCALVIPGFAVLVFLFYSGFIYLEKGPLPTVLTSVHHMEEVLVDAPPSTPLFSFLTVEAALPSSGAARHKQSSSDESDGDSDTESTGGAYKLRVGTNLSSSSTSSSSSSSLPAPSSPRLELLPPQTSETEAHSSAALSTHTDGHTQPAGGIELDEKEALGGGGSHNVNLLTLTFGRREEQEHKSQFDAAESEEEDPPASEECTSFQPSQTLDTRDVVVETVPSAAEEEEEEEESGYMERPCTDVLHKLL